MKTSKSNVKKIYVYTYMHTPWKEKIPRNSNCH